MLEKILCVDDDPITLMLCKKVITKSNFSTSIDSANDGVEALKYFDNLIEQQIDINYPQLIFLDLNMPIMDGWQFLDIFSNNHYSKKFPNTKVIVLSSSIDPKDINKSKNYPMVIEFLAKPITLQMLDSLKTSANFVA